MRSIIVLLCLILAPSVVNGQNLIQNPGFESGAIPIYQGQVNYATGWSTNCGRHYISTYPYSAAGTPDLFDSRSTNCLYGIPSNKWGVRNVRAGGYRYVGFSGESAVNGTQFYGETVEGSLTGALIACNYQVSFWASAIDGYRQQLNCSLPIDSKVPNPIYNKIEIVLRQGNNCNQGKVVYTSPSITSLTWQQYVGQFTLSAADAAAGYDRIEFRLLVEPYPQPTGTVGTAHIVYLDDVELIAQGQQPLDPDFQLTATNLSGNATTYQLTATSTPLPNGAGFWWQVEELDLVTGNVLPNSTVTNPSAWWGNPTTNVFSGYNGTSTLGNTSNVGLFQQGHKYRITRGVWSSCSPWAAKAKTAYMCTNC